LRARNTNIEEACHLSAKNTGRPNETNSIASCHKIEVKQSPIEMPLFTL